MTSGDAHPDKEFDYDRRIADQALATRDSDLNRAFIQILKEVLDLRDTPYAPSHWVWRHELPWYAKNVTRLGYLLIGTPAERSMVQQDGDFYLYFLPLGRRAEGEDAKQDEVYFQLATPGEEFLQVLRRFAAADALCTQSTLSYRRGYSELRNLLWNQLLNWLRMHFNDAISVTFEGTTKALAEWSVSADERQQRPRERADAVAATLLARHFENRYPKYPVFDNTSIPAAGTGGERTPLHPWFAVRRRAMADLAVQRARTADRPEEPSEKDGRLTDARRFLDLCSGVATIAEAAARHDLSVTAVDSSPVATLIARANLDYSRDHTLLTPSLEWKGIEGELDEAAIRVLHAARTTVTTSWLADIDVVLMVATVRCPSCGADVPRTTEVRLTPSNYLTVTWLGELAFELTSAKPDRRNTRRCLRCHLQLGRAPVTARRFVPAAIATWGGQDRTWAAVTPSGLIDGLQVSRNVSFPSGEATFSYVRSRSVTWEAMTSGRQRVILAALRDATAEERRRLAARDVPARALEAMGAYLALLVSSTLPYLTTATVWASTGRVSPAPSSGAWLPGNAYVEVGGRTIEAAWLRRADEATASSGDDKGSRVRVVRGDARNLGEPDGAFDLAIWDPPFYDNVDYDGLASPFEQILRSVIPDHPDLIGPPFHGQGKRFDEETYRSDLQAMAAQGHRVLSEGGHLGVWWLSRTSEELQGFIDMVGGAGLELRTAMSIDTERGANSAHRTTHRTYLLVFQKATAVISVEAAVVLALADAGLPSLYHGLASLLEEEYSPEELEAMIPADFRGDFRDRLVEFVATHPRPDELLLDLGRRPLRAVANRLQIEVDPAADVRHLARLVLASLGFSTPETPRFSVESAADELRRVTSDLRLARDSLEAQVPFARAEQNVLRILRLSVECWSRLMSGSGWEATVAALVRESGGRSTGVNRMTLGDWKAAFVELPKRFATSSSSIGRLFQSHQRTLKRLKAPAVLDNFVSVRNRLAHPGDEPPPDPSRISESLGRLAALIDDLISAQVLPVVLTPEEVRRDRWGRTLLVAIDGRGGTAELVVSEPIDLTRPLIWLPRLVNPREVDPILLAIDEFEPFRTPAL